MRLIPLGGKSQEDVLLDKALPACAADPEWRLRDAVAITVGGRFIWEIQPKKPDPRAVALCMKLAEDSNSKVRYNAIYHGLSPIADKSDEVIAALLKAVAAGPAKENDASGRVEWGLAMVPPKQLAAQIEPYLARHKEAPEQAFLAYKIYFNATKTEPPGAERVDDVGPFIVLFNIGGPEGKDPKLAMELVRKHVPESLVPTVVFFPDRGSRFQGVALRRT